MLPTPTLETVPLNRMLVALSEQAWSRRMQDRQKKNQLTDTAPSAEHAFEDGDLQVTEEYTDELRQLLNE